jgi:hypothetical protein
VPAVSSPLFYKTAKKKKGKGPDSPAPGPVYGKKRETIALDDLIREIHQISVLQKIWPKPAVAACISFFQAPILPLSDDRLTLPAGPAICMLMLFLHNVDAL